jgi:predicted Zn finger-like uncharacterized protein
MPIQINCPSCSRALRVPDELLGKDVKCPTCGTTFTASAEGPAPAPVAEQPLSPPPGRRPAPPDEYDEGPPETERRRSPRRREYLQPHRGAAVLVLGILSVVGVASVITGPIAWSMGSHDLKEIRAGRMDPEGEGMTNAGRICGIIGTVLGILALVCCLAYFGFIIAMAASGQLK